MSEGINRADDIPQTSPRVIALIAIDPVHSSQRGVSKTEQCTMDSLRSVLSIAAHILADEEKEAEMYSELCLHAVRNEILIL